MMLRKVFAFLVLSFAIVSTASGLYAGMAYNAGGGPLLQSAAGLVVIPNGTSNTIAGVTYIAGNGNYPPNNKPYAQMGLLNPAGNSLDRFEVKLGDYPPPGSLTKDRAEYGQQNVIANGTTVWMSYAVYFFQSAVDGNCTVGQYHPTQGVGDTVEGTNAFMAFFNGTLRFDTQTSTQVPLTINPPQTELLRITPPIGQWVNFVHQINIDPNGVTSLWNVWMNGTQILNSTAAIGFSSSQGNFFKPPGCYRNQINVDSTVWTANVEFSTSSLASRITAPLPFPTVQVFWLLKRDLDPGSNDNDPMWLEKAA